MQRDIIDLTAPGEEHLAQHAELCRAVIASRAPELSDQDLALAFAPPSNPTEKSGNESTMG